jgi:hypothetical protein
MSAVPVTLQISLAPSDYRHAQQLLPHQVRAWRDQVDDILLTIDFHRSPGRFSARWEEGRDRILPLAQSIPGARVAPVDYGEAAHARVAAEFFGGQRIPKKDFRGGPFYSYFFGLSQARHDHVLHTDSDLFFGGGSATWLGEAVAHLAAHPEVLFAAPLPGPPLPGRPPLQLEATAEPDQENAFRFSFMSTRLFLLRRARFRAVVGALEPRRPPKLKDTLLARLEGNPPEDSPENLFTAAMRARGLVSRAFLGATPGRWSLHPPYRDADFYAKLPELIRRIESGDVPDAQRGDHDLNESLVDWTEATVALAHNRWWRRLLRRVVTHSSSR